MSFFQRVGNAMARFMYGRNGGDRLGLATIWTAIVIDVVCLFIKGQQVLYLILSTLSTAMVLWALWRMFSRNLAKRRAENAWFMSKVCWPVKNAFGLTRTRMRDREHKYIACPKCRTVCRVPRGKGRIVITCPKCREEIHTKSGIEAAARPVSREGNGPFDVLGGRSAFGGWRSSSVSPTGAFLSIAKERHERTPLET